MTSSNGHQREERARVRVCAALARVEALPSGASGALLVGRREHPDGMILVESNRVCWAVAAGMRQRLQDILRSHSNLPLGGAELEALYARCRNEHQPLGETLVAEGLVSAEQLRAALKQHTVESLLAIDHVEGDAEWPLTWLERSARYNPRYTFTAAEILAGVGATFIDPTDAELIEDHLQALAGAGCAVVAWSGGSAEAPRFVGAQSAWWLPIADLLELTEWAGAALDASPGFSPVVTFACAHSAAAGAVAWTYQGRRCAALCPSATALRRLVAMLDNLSLAMVLATTLSVLERVRERMSVAKG